MFYQINKHIDKFLKDYMRSESEDLLYEDPTYIGFNMMIMFEESPLFNVYGDKASAIHYLEAIGYPKKADMLREMGRVLKNLINNHPYYFQSLTGLKSLWSLDMSEPLRTKDAEIEITTLETIDMTMTYIMNLYRNACYDIHPSSYRVLLPRNLRQFRILIYVSEMRKFHTLDTGEDSSGNYHLKELKDLISVMAWDLHGCEFNFNDGMNYLEELSNSTMPEMATNSFKFKPSWIREQSTFKLFNTQLDQYGDDKVIINNPQETFKTWEDDINPSNNNFERFANRGGLDLTPTEDNKKGFVTPNGVPPIPPIPTPPKYPTPIGNAYGLGDGFNGLTNDLAAMFGQKSPNTPKSTQELIQANLLGNVFDGTATITKERLGGILGNTLGSKLNLDDVF